MAPRPMPLNSSPPSTRTNRWITAAILSLLLILSAQVLHAIHGQSLTWDEDDHIFAGYESWKTHDFGLNPEHPPMVKLLATLPLLPLHLNVPPLQHRFFKEEAYLDGHDLLFHNGPANGNHYSAETLVFRARLPTLLFALAAALLVFFATREMFNLRAALIALTLFCFDPTLLAFGAYVTTDMAASCTLFATIYALWRYLQRPTPARLLVTGIAAGLALAAKHSTVLLAPILIILLLGELSFSWFTQQPVCPTACPEPAEGSGFSDIVSNKATISRGCPIHDAASSRHGWGDALNRNPLLHLLTAFVLITLTAVLVLWAFYGFRYAARPAPLTLSPSLADYVGPLAASKLAASSSPPASTSSPKAISTASRTSATWLTTCLASSSATSTSTASGTTSP